VPEYRRRWPLRVASASLIAIAAVAAVAVISGQGLVTRPASASTRARAARIVDTASARARAARIVDSGSGRARANLTVDTATRDGQPIPSGFVGLSFEYAAVEAYAGNDPSAVDPVLVQLIRNLSPGQVPVLRIGGDSTDWAWWPIRGMRRPHGVRINLDHRFLEVTNALAATLNARLILGIDLEANDRRLAAAEGRAFTAGITRGRIRALELGNEPELYGSFPWYVTRAGVRVRGRPHDYDVTAYLRDFAKLSAALRSAPLAGPASGGPKWMSQLNRILDAAPRVQLATLHRYPMQTCYIPPDQLRYPTIAHMLSPVASAGLADSIVPEVAVAHAHHVPLRIDEINTIGCGSAPRVGESFGSALWALDVLFQMARVGVTGINMHSYPGAPYQLFTFTDVGGHWRAFVEPEYYGMLMFARAAPPGSRLLRITAHLGTNIRAWATRDTGGTVRVTVINVGARARTIRLDLAQTAGGAPRAALERLTAPSVGARTGVTLAGQSFGAQTTTGLLTGQARTPALTPRSGIYTVTIAPASAVMITVAHG